MKRLKSVVLAMVGILVFVLSSSIVLAETPLIHLRGLFKAETIVASGSATSLKVDLSALKPIGYFSLQIALTGDGTAKAEYLMSNDGSVYIEPTGASDIVTGFTKTSGPGSDGKGFFSFEPKLGPYLKIKITETGTSDSVTVSATLAIQ